MLDILQTIHAKYNNNINAINFLHVQTTPLISFVKPAPIRTRNGYSVVLRPDAVKNMYFSLRFNHKTMVL